MNAQLVKKYEAIDAIKQRYLKRVSSVSLEKLNAIPANGGWSLGQVLFHVAYAESGTVLVINRNLAEDKVKLKSNISAIVRHLLLVAFLRSPFKAKAPKGVSKVPESITHDEISKYFDKNTTDFKKILADLPTELENKFIFKHPVGGLFNIEHTLDFVREHYLHHEMQLNALLK